MPSFHDARAVSAQALIDAAVDDAQLDDFGVESFRPGLDLICAALADAQVRPGGRHMLGAEIVRYLANRLRVVDWHARNPRASSTSIDAPLVILGLPRTGTTAISYLLDCDPQWRCLLNWEAVFSVPPSTDDTLRSDPRCVELREFQQAIVDSIDPPPPHWEWADGPTECTFLLAGDCRSVMWDSRLRSPAHREWIMSTDMTPAYDYHRLTLQCLGSATSGTWCLKMPAHALFVDALLAAYPDARIIWTHRDPVAVTASFLNLGSFSQNLTYGDAQLDVAACLDRLVEQVERPMRALAGRDVYHMHYDRYLGDPMAEVRRLYDWLGASLDEPVRRSMKAWLGADPLEVSRRGRATVDDFGLSVGQVRVRFGDYIDFAAAMR